MAKKKYYKNRARSKSGKKSKRKYSLAQRKAYWMGVGAADVIWEDGNQVNHLPTWKFLSADALESYEKGLKKKSKYHG